MWLWFLRDSNQRLIALQIKEPILSSERAPYMKKRKVIVKQKKLKSGHGTQRGPNTKTNLLTDLRSQYNLNLNLRREEKRREEKRREEKRREEKRREEKRIRSIGQCETTHRIYRMRQK
jgi:CelD/BcsL family acetyltransferase involved in cellulose biosynthesis